MKTRFLFGLVLVAATSVLVSNAQEFILTVTPANVTSSRASIDMPGLSGNPLAIIIAIPLDDTELLNPHPIGAWYYNDKWNIFNSDHAVMPVGSKYRIRFFPRPGPSQFLHFITPQNIGAEGSYIDHPALNGNPDVQFVILQNHAPEVRSNAALNRFEVRIAYSTGAGRWYIANVNGQPLSRAAYNIVISAGAGQTTPTPGASPTPVIIPQSTPADRTPPKPPVIEASPTPIGPVDKPIGKVPPRPTPQPTPVPEPTPLPLNGFVDMHTHPMSHLGFGKKLLHGVPDGGVGPDNQPNGSIVPAGTNNCNPQDFRASNIFDALSNCSSTHGGWGLSNPCGDHIRSFVISNLFDDEFVFKLGNDPTQGGNLLGDHRHEGIDSHPQFLYFPNQSSKVHQQMWWEWIKRAKELGNLRVMVALTVNSELLAKILNGDAPQDDKATADLQIDEIVSFVGRHNDFMEVAYTPADLRRIVGQNKLAVVLGMEVDNIGNFNKTVGEVSETTVRNEIGRLHAKGIRYIFPIHLVNNRFGGAAVYEDLFNFANKYSTGSFYKVQPSDHFQYRLKTMSDVGVFLSVNKDLRPFLNALSGIPYPPAFNADPTSPDFCLNPIPFHGSLGCWRTFRLLKGILNTPPEYQIYAATPQNKGHVNELGLTLTGKFAVKEMMRLGMMIDMDHMSDKSQNDTLDLAESFGYPINMGHNGLRKPSGSERHASLSSIRRIAKLGGVFGVGTADSDEHRTDASSFITSYNEVWSAMSSVAGGIPRVAIGTDVNGMERLPRASGGLNSDTFYTSEFPAARTGNRTWFYPIEGVAHYGLLADFMKDVRARDLSVQQRLMDSAESFARMWEKTDAQKTSIR